MKSEEQIQDKICQLKYEHLQRRIQERTRPSPKNCKHNYKEESSNGSVRICMLGADGPNDWGGRICDDDRMAQECPFFEPKKDEQEIREDFEEDIMDPEIVNTSFRDISALRWALDSDGYGEDIGWWQRMTYKLMGY